MQTWTKQKPPSLEAAAVSAEGKLFGAIVPQERMGVMREDEIRERLAKATLGVDVTYEDLSAGRNFQKHAKSDIEYLLKSNEFTSALLADAELQANELLDENQRLRNVLDMIKKLCRDEAMPMDLRVTLAYEHARQALQPVEPTSCTPS